jgi:phosphate transport system permease protein
MLILCVCLSVCVPVGLGTAALLAEFTTEENRFAMLVRRSLDILAGIPSIVFGLFGSVFFCQVLGLGFSILSGGLTLACMTLPLFIRAAEDGLCAVPKEYRHAAAALGLSRTSTLLRVVFPAATSGIIVGLVLAIGRALAETAALVFTSGYVTRMPDSLFDSGRALAVHIYDLAMNVTAGEPAAYRSALVLIVLLMLTNSFAAAITQRIFIGR